MQCKPPVVFQDGFEKTRPPAISQSGPWHAGALRWLASRVT
jgi:hypothetical protein